LIKINDQLNGAVTGLDEFGTPTIIGDGLLVHVEQAAKATAFHASHERQ
jgi:hypothetical protein